MTNDLHLRAIVKEQLDLHGYDYLNNQQVDDITDWFSHWLDDSYDAISDAIYGACRDCGISTAIDDMDVEECEPYTPSATAGDYSPSCPWNAPGMSVSDFI